MSEPYFSMALRLSCLIIICSTKVRPNIILFKSTCSDSVGHNRMPTRNCLALPDRSRQSLKCAFQKTRSLSYHTGKLPNTSKPFLGIEPGMPFKFRCSNGSRFSQDAAVICQPRILKELPASLWDRVGCQFVRMFLYGIWHAHQSTELLQARTCENFSEPFLLILLASSQQPASHPRQSAMDIGDI